MEFLEGETLAERLRRGALPVNEIFKIGISIAEALAIAHRQGIVHRALKPGNLMLTQAGAKLMDFGLAKPLAVANSGPTSASAPSFTAAPTMSGASPLTPLTTAGTVIGTIQYMSPEQIEGKEADARYDIFAFGAVLYEMTTGKRPFQGKSEISLAFRNSRKRSRTDQRDQTANFAVIRLRRRDLPAEKSRRALPDCARYQARTATDCRPEASNRNSRGPARVAAKAVAPGLERSPPRHPPRHHRRIPSAPPGSWAIDSHRHQPSRAGACQPHRRYRWTSRPFARSFQGRVRRYRRRWQDHYLDAPRQLPRCPPVPRNRRLHLSFLVLRRPFHRVLRRRQIKNRGPVRWLPPNSRRGLLRSRRRMGRRWRHCLLAHDSWPTLPRQRQRWCCRSSVNVGLYPSWSHDGKDLYTAKNFTTSTLRTRFMPRR